MNGKRYYNFCTISATERDGSALNKNSVTVVLYFIFNPYLFEAYVRNFHI